jgi:hypothetical protein
MASCAKTNPARAAGGVGGEPFARPPGEGSVWRKHARKLLVMPSPEKLAERSFFDPSRFAGGVRKSFMRNDLKTARPPIESGGLSAAMGSGISIPGIGLASPLDK